MLIFHRNLKDSVKIDPMESENTTSQIRQNISLNEVRKDTNVQTVFELMLQIIH